MIISLGFDALKKGGRGKGTLQSRCNALHVPGSMAALMGNGQKRDLAIYAFFNQHLLTNPCSNSPRSAKQPILKSFGGSARRNRPFVGRKSSKMALRLRGQMCLREQNLKISPRPRYSLRKPVFVRFFGQRTNLKSFLGSNDRFGSGMGVAGWGQSMNRVIGGYYWIH